MMSAAMAAFSIMRSQNWQEIAKGASDFTGSSSFTSIYDGVASVGNAVAGAAEAAWNSLTTASNTVMSSLGQEVAVEAAKTAGGEIAKEGLIDGLMHTVEQKVMGIRLNNAGQAGGPCGQGVAQEPMSPTKRGFQVDEGKTGMGRRLFGQKRLSNKAEKIDTEHNLRRCLK